MPPKIKEDAASEENTSTLPPPKIKQETPSPQATSTLPPPHQQPPPPPFPTPDSYWNHLLQNASSLILFIAPTTDPFLYALTNRHFDELEPMAGKDHGDTMIHLVAMYVDRTTASTTREGMIYLARSRWDLEAAVQKYHDADEGVVVEEVSEGEEGEEGESSGLSEPPAESGEEVESEEGSESEEGGDTKEARKKRRQRANRRLNPNINRQNVVKGRPQPEKLTVSIVVPKKSGTVTKQSHFLKFDKGRSLDWANGEHIRHLNKWREQLFLRRLGPSRPPRTPYHAAERRWLVNRHLQYQRERRARTGHVEDWRTFPWHTVMQEFNAHFAGKIIEGAPRPPRTKMSLRDEKCRIAELTTLTGTEPKKAPAALGAKKGADEEEHGDTTDEEELPPAKKGKRGDDEKEEE